MKRKITTLYILKEFKDFECKKCGACCKDWSIHLDSRASKSLHKLLKNVSYTKEWHERKGKKNYLKMVNGRCIFLEEDNLCYLHKNFGYERKPIVCKTFPRSFLFTPKGVFQIVTFACPSIAESVSKEEGPSYITYPWDGEREIEEELLLSEKIKIKWDLYFWIEETLLDIILQKNPLEEKLSLCALFLQNIHEILMEKDERNAKIYILSEREKEYRNLLESIKKFEANVKAQYNFLKNFLNFLKIVSPSTKIPPIPQTPIEYMRVVHRGWKKELIERPLKKYIQYKILGKSIINPSVGILLSFNLLLIYHAFIRWCTSSAVKEKNYSTEKALQDAIVTVERTFYHSSILKKVWKKLKTHKIISTPQFAHFMLTI